MVDRNPVVRWIFVVRFTFFFRYKKSPQNHPLHPGSHGMNREETWDESPKCKFGFRGCEIAMINIYIIIYIYISTR
jgi:hypothetical protein